MTTRDFVRAIGGLLASAGYAVRSATNGRDGLGPRQDDPAGPDPARRHDDRADRGVLHAAADPRASRPCSSTPVIVISSIYTDQPIFRVSPEAGWLPANLFLPKPVDPARLLEEVARLIAASALPAAEASHAGSDGR